MKGIWNLPISHENYSSLTGFSPNSQTFVIEAFTQPKISVLFLILKIVKSLLLFENFSKQDNDVPVKQQNPLFFTTVTQKINF